MQNTYERHFPQKRVKCNKYQHKLSNWITTGILKSIEFRDNLYKRLKLCPIDSPYYETYKHNLKMYQGYLNQCIRTAKKEYYVKEFTKYKNGRRETHLKVSFVRIKWNRNIHGTLSTEGNK